MPSTPTLTLGRPIIFAAFLAVLFVLYVMSSKGSIPVPASPPRNYHYEYTVQKGYFMQSEEETDDKNFNFQKQNFGLISRSYETKVPSDATQWSQFEDHVRQLQSTAKLGESYKVLFLGRHGQGWHNVAESKYGTHAWDCYWSALDGDNDMAWSDAHLTPVGQQQALDVHSLWEKQLPLGIPAPEAYYVSPLTRTIQTADLSFKNLDLPSDKPYKPFIKELLREALGVHTCDRRSTRTQLEDAFKHLTFEPQFSDADLLWEKDYREPRSARHYRLAQLLDDLFTSDDKVFLSLTSHSGAIGSILEVLGHRRFALETGGVIPVFVRARKVDGARPVPPKEPSDSPPMCDGPPA